MKRKLDEGNIPSPPRAVDNTAQGGGGTFATLGLDPRLLQSIAHEKFASPTLVQAKAIPLALIGKDILARAKTGSGKTAAYLLPVLHSILRFKAVHPDTRKTSGLILVPTRELAEQVHKTILSFTTFCAQDIRAINLTHKVSETVQRSLLADSPDIVIATPARASSNISSAVLDLQNLSHLVIDEADLLLSYGYEDDLKVVSTSIPKGVQTFLMSATLTSEVRILKGQFCKNPVILKLEEGENPNEGVSQYVVRCAEDEKFLLAYVIFKLKLIKGKCIIFVGDIDRSYRLKLFLEQFGLRSCVLNSELPVNSRIHIVDEFNKNIYDIIIATDEHESFGEEDDPKENSIDEVSQRQIGIEHTNGGVHSKKLPKSAASKKRKTTKKDKEYGISRGIDFKNVACVLNFDLPTSSRAYTHRIGRTARAGNTGMALSFVIPKDQYRQHKSTSFPTTEHDEAILSKITQHQAQKGKDLHPYHFDMKQVDAFRYRMGDALRAVSRIAIREARTRELRQELLKSEKLKRHFEEHPDDLHHLRHDGELRAAKVQPHLKHVPDYLLPSEGKNALAGAGAGAGDGVGFVGLNKAPDSSRTRKGKLNDRFKGRGRRVGGKPTDPLKTFKTKKR